MRFVSEGVPVDAKGRGDVTPLHEAAEAGHTKVAEWLLDQGANVNARTVAQRGYPGAETPLFLAVEKRKPATAEMLLRRGANPNLKSSDGSSVLDCAAESGDLALVALLIRHRARVAPKGESNPLLRALCAQHLEIAKFLVDNGAPIDAKGGPFNAPLLVAIAGGKWLPGIEFLLSLGADVNQTDDRGMTALHYAVLSFGTAKYETVKNRSRETTAMTERPEDALPVVERLLQAGARRDMLDKDGLTPVDWAQKLLTEKKALLELLGKWEVSTR
jgi:ankyrin repeat protein